MRLRLVQAALYGVCVSLDRLAALFHRFKSGPATFAWTYSLHHIRPFVFPGWLIGLAVVGMRL